MSTTLFLAIIALSLPSIVSAAQCYDTYYGYYECSSLSSGARIGIGIGIALVILAVIMLFGYMRRKRLMKQWRAHQAQQASSLPQYQNPTTAYGPGAGGPNLQQPNAQGYYGPPPMQQYPSQGGGGYAPPPGSPPANMGNGGYGYNNTAGVKVPQSAYRPGFNTTSSTTGSGMGPGTGTGEVHGYEYQQEMENRRREEENAASGIGGGMSGPPGYEAAVGSPGVVSNGTGEAASYYNSPAGVPSSRKGGMAV